MNRKTSIIIINPRDNVGVARVEIKGGQKVCLPQGGEVEAKTSIPRGHKIALKDIPSGGEIVKYGEVIGRAKEAIHAGEWVHTHNMG
jgi:altronate dehydratase